MTVAFFGHADFIGDFQDERKLLSLLEEVVGEAEVDFLLGEYGDFDRFARECARKYREKHAVARLIFVTPYFIPEQTAEEKRRRFEPFDTILYPPLENVPLRFCIAHRNRWMVERADVVICCVSHSYGGAYEAYRYAVRKRKKLYNFAARSVEGKE